MVVNLYSKTVNVPKWAARWNLDFISNTYSILLFYFVCNNSYKLKTIQRVNITQLGGKSNKLAT